MYRRIVFILVVKLQPSTSAKLLPAARNSQQLRMSGARYREVRGCLGKRERKREREREREVFEVTRTCPVYSRNLYGASSYTSANDRSVTARGGDGSLFRVLSRLDSLSCRNFRISETAWRNENHIFMFWSWSWIMMKENERFGSISSSD